MTSILTPPRLLETFRTIRDRTVAITEPLLDEDMVAQPVVDVSPPKWHLAHTTWFFEEFILRRFDSDYKVFHPSYRFLFNSYYESVGDRTPRVSRGSLTRPGREEILAYRAHVDEAMASLLSEELPAEAEMFLELGLHHEQQHQELLVTDIKYTLGHHPLFPAYGPSDSRELAEPLSDARWLEIDEGVYQVGHKGDSFAFDNEKGRHSVFLHPYRIMERPVLNGEFLEFIAEGGYHDFQYWLSDGWAWVCQNQPEAPEYWHLVDDRWHQYTLSGLQPVDIHAPLTHINYYEADAFARFMGCRLPTEQEWEVAAMTYEPEVPAGANFLEEGLYQPVAAGRETWFAGSVWEWTNSAYLAYPYYKQDTGALGEYNGKWMSGQMVLRGGSCATPRSHYRHTYRNFFQPEKRWQFSGLRLAQHL